MEFEIVLRLTTSIRRADVIVEKVQEEIKHALLEGVNDFNKEEKSFKASLTSVKRVV